MSLKWRSELIFILVLLAVVASWAVLRIVFWVSFFFVGYDPPAVFDTAGLTPVATVAEFDPLLAKHVLLIVWLEGIISSCDFFTDSFVLA